MVNSCLCIERLQEGYLMDSIVEGPTVQSLVLPFEVALVGGLERGHRSLHVYGTSCERRLLVSLEVGARTGHLKLGLECSHIGIWLL